MANPTPLEEIRSLIVKGEVDQPIQKISEFLNGDFFNDEALFMLGGCLMSKGLSGLAAVVTSAAVDARTAKGKAFPEALLNLGSAYKTEHKNDVALRIWLDALKHETLPRERAKIMTNLSGLYINENHPEEAIRWCDRALKEDPHNHGAAANRGLACLELGRWREGWEGWAHTYDTGDRSRRSYGRLPVWDGAPTGQRVIVWGDQGVGDEIYYANCLSDMHERCNKVILDCHPRLDKLFARSFPEIEVHGTRKHLTELDWFVDGVADAHICLSDLPGRFRNEDSEWRGQAYLRADKENRFDPCFYDGIDNPHHARRRVSEDPLRIGLSWTGGTKRTRTELRSLPLSALEPILRARPDAAWFSLQYTPNAAREVCELEEKTGIRISHYPGWVECFDYDRTASFVSSLDLVITVCTTVHHLGGALGVPTWTLVPSRPSWRYQIKGERLPWYDSARLFRQERDGDWSWPINRIVSALADL